MDEQMGEKADQCRCEAFVIDGNREGLASPFGACDQQRHEPI